MTDVVLDSGAVSAWASGRRDLAAVLEAAAREGRRAIVPTVVIAESTTGAGTRDAATNRRLAGAVLCPCDEALARRAAALRHRAGAGRNKAIDAIVVATAEWFGSIVVTADLDDLTLLAAGTNVRIIGLGSTPR